MVTVPTQREEEFPGRWLPQGWGSRLGAPCVLPTASGSSSLLLSMQPWWQQPPQSLLEMQSPGPTQAFLPSQSAGNEAALCTWNIHTCGWRHPHPSGQTVEAEAALTPRRV